MKRFKMNNQTKTRYKELALDGMDLRIMKRIQQNISSTENAHKHKSEEEIIREVLLNAIKDYSNNEESIEKIEDRLTSENGITQLSIIKKSFTINFQSALYKTLDKLGYKNYALDIVKESSIDNGNISKLNSGQIDTLMEILNIKNERDSSADFDGGHFSGDFDTRLMDFGYIRLCVERTSLNDELMILVEKEILDNLIKKNYSYDVLFECEKAYTTENNESYEDFLNAYFEMYEPIIKDLNLNIEDISMYIDGIDYIQDESEKLGYTFGKEKFSKSLSENLISIENRPSIEEAKKLLEKHSSPSIELQ